MNIESVQTVTISIQQCVGIIACSVIITALATVLCMLYIPYQTIFSKVDFYVKEYSLNILFFFAKLGVINDLNKCSFTRPNIDHDGNCLKSSREQQPIPGLDNENRDYLETRQETNETMNSSKDDIRKLNAKLPPNMT